jgi:hypothetical protein
VGGEHDRRALRHLGLLVDEDGAARLEVADDVEVVDDLLADVDRRPVEVERLLDRLDRALDAGAVAAGSRQEHLRDPAGRVPSPGTDQARCSGGRRSGPRVIAHRGIWPGARAADRIAQWQ